MPEVERVAGRGGPPWLPRSARLILPVAIALAVQVPASIWGALRFGHDSPWRTGLHIALAVAGPLALLGARRFPGPAVLVVSALAAVDVLIAPTPGPPYVAVAFAIVGAVARGAGVWAAAAVVTGWATVLLIASFDGRQWHPPLVVAATLALAACFGVGGFVRTRRARFAARREEWMRQRQSAEERERVRIARELHDVLGHALSQISVQAGVGLHLFDRDPEQARAALANVKRTSKLALDEVRDVLGVLRDGEAPLRPESGLAELPQLVAGAGGPGFDATLEDRLGGDLPDRATQLAAYRIVQEALTNAVRHSGARQVRVRLERSPEEMLVVTVTDDGRGFGAADPITAGHRGILGMRERASLLGGTVEVLDVRAGDIAVGGFETGSVQTGTSEKGSAGAGVQTGGVRVVAVLPWGRGA